jgi:translation initiation factor IF-2
MTEKKVKKENITKDTTNKPKKTKKVTAAKAKTVDTKAKTDKKQVKKKNSSPASSTTAAKKNSNKTSKVSADKTNKKTVSKKTENLKTETKKQQTKRKQEPKKTEQSAQQKTEKKQEQKTTETKQQEPKKQSGNQQNKQTQIKVKQPQQTKQEPDQNKKDIKQQEQEQIQQPVQPKQQEKPVEKVQQPVQQEQPKQTEPPKPPEPEKPALPKITINELVTIKDLAEKMKVKIGDILKKLLSMGSIATLNQRIDTDTATILANEFGFDVDFVSLYEEENIEQGKEDDKASLLPRSPIVTIMGHVDHGKTSLLDALRHSNVVAGEAGGITQHIGAYRVKTSDGEITFLDTPGHEAFTAMRSRGAQVTDIVILVVSATDGVMPQTIEAINHAKAANVPIIVAVNKIDLPNAEPEKIRQELSNYGLLPEEWGGDTIMVDISAKQKLNIDSLLEMVQLKAEIMELKANPNKRAEGVVIEAKLDPRKGTVATILVQSGTLRVGDNIVVGTTYGKIRAMVDEYGKRFMAAIPSMPVEVLGINEPPQAGDKFIVLEKESQAREIAQARKEKVKAEALKPKHHVSLQDISMGKIKNLNIILKTDVQGSLGALCDALERMSNSEIKLNIIHKGAGSITESDVVLAAASDAMIVGFNIRPDAAVSKAAEQEGVHINVYRIIYELIADIKAAMEGLLSPETKERITGKAVVKQVFKLSSAGTISGCMVSEGKAERGSKVRLLRDNVIVFEGSLSSLKRFKDDVKEVEKGYECGIGLEKFSDVKTGDVMEFFKIDKLARKLVEE